MPRDWETHIVNTEEAVQADFLMQMFDDLDFLATEFPDMKDEAIALRQKVGAKLDLDDGTDWSQ